MSVEIARGTVMVPVPVTGLAANFSPIPRIEPPPFGRDIDGAETRKPSLLSELGCELPDDRYVEFVRGLTGMSFHLPEPRPLLIFSDYCNHASD
jgi:hypothetical protein